MTQWVIDWSTGEDDMADEFNVYTREIGESAWRPYGTTRGKTMTIVMPDVMESYEAAVAGLVNGIEEFEDDWALFGFTPGSVDDFDPPPDVTELAVAQLDNTFDLRLQWPPVDAPQLVGYEIRQGNAWDIAAPRAFVPALQTTAQIGMWNGESTTFLVKALNEQGMWSAIAASAILIVLNQSLFVEEAATDESGGGFTGTKTDMEVDSGDLRIEVHPAAASGWTDVASTYTDIMWLPHKGSGTYQTAAIEATDGATPTPAGIIVDEVVLLDTAFTAAQPDAPTAADWIHPIRLPDTFGDKGLYSRVAANEEDLLGQDIGIEIDTTPDDPGGTPTWDGFRTWIPGARYRYRGVRFRLTFTSEFFTLFRMTQFIIRRFRKNLKDESTVTVTATGGTAVTFDQPFTKVPVVQATVEDASNARHATLGSVTRTGCDVFAWDSGGVERDDSVLVHVTAAGV